MNHRRYIENTQNQKLRIVNDHCMVCLPNHWHIVTEERLWNIQVTYEERHRHPHMERIPYDSNSLNPGRLFIGHPCEKYVPREKNKAPRHSSALSGVYKAWVDPAASIPHDHICISMATHWNLSYSTLSFAHFSDFMKMTTVWFVSLFIDT